jgi:peptidoglycan-N-acetylglucosamine deacetylase
MSTPPASAAVRRPLASLSLDLDNEWAYLKTQGNPAWRDYPSYLDTVLPFIEDALARQRLRITVFVVGQDAALPGSRAVLQRLAAAGHEMGNHSMAHEPWMHERSVAELEDELQAAEAAIQAATGHRPRGFRGPGFSLSPQLLQVLQRRGYAYDASTFPSILGPLARAYYLVRSRPGPAERQRLSRLFGRFSDGLRPLRPYHWQWPGERLLELPVTTMPLLRLPMHLSYVMFIAQVSPALALAYFRLGLALCRLRGVAPSVLLHPLDFLDGDAVPSLRFLPAMGLPARRKRAVLDRCLAALAEAFEVLPLAEFARRSAQEVLPTQQARVA